MNQVFGCWSASHKPDHASDPEIGLTALIGEATGCQYERAEDAQGLTMHLPKQGAPI
jgi:hypothetical protein